MTVIASTDAATREFATAVAIGLSDSPKWIPSRFLYDAQGSALFERICETPEYYPTRTESAILARHAAEFARHTGAVTLIELGSGSAVKTDHLLRAYADGATPVRYVPVDVSASILRVARERIEREFHSVEVQGVHGEYARAFPLLTRYDPAMLVFLGSTIGNLDRSEALQFWTAVAEAAPPGGYVLLGADLVKDRSVIEAAYNDAAGVTAQFTKNLFARMNRELGSGIDLAAIEHVARYNAAWRRVEISVRFTKTQQVDVEPLGRRFTVHAGEHVLTEISRKFVVDDLAAYLAGFGFALEHVATDERDWFAVLLLRKEDDDGSPDD